MDDHLKQFLKLDAMIKPSHREFESRLWNVYIGIIMLFISLLFPFLLFLLFTFFFLFNYHVILLVCYFFFQNLCYIRIRYSRIHEQTATAWICCRDAQADLGLCCPHTQKEPFCHYMALSSSLKQEAFRSIVFHFSALSLSCM